MDKKIKLILIGLAGALVLSCMFIFYVLSAKEMVSRERDDLKKENISLGDKVEKLASEIRNSQNTISSMKRDLERLNQEKKDFEGRFMLANRAKDELMARLKELESQGPQISQQPMAQTADAYWANILKQKTELEFRFNGIATEFKAMQVATEQLQREKSMLSLEIDGLKRTKDDLARQLEYNQKLMDSIAQDLVRERSDRMKVEDSTKVIKNENAILRRQLDSLNRRKVELEKKLQGLQAEKTTVEQKVTSMETMLTEKISQINDFQQQLDAIRKNQSLPTSSDVSMGAVKNDSVELPAIVVQSNESAVGQAASSGKILEVRRDKNFVIVDLGLDTGLRQGSTLQVLRMDKPIAVLEVIQARNSIAACDIAKEETPVQVGDTVK